MSCHSYTPGRRTRQPGVPFRYARLRIQIVARVHQGSTFRIRRNVRFFNVGVIFGVGLAVFAAEANLTHMIHWQLKIDRGPWLFVSNQGLPPACSTNSYVVTAPILPKYFTDYASNKRIDKTHLTTRYFNF